MQKRNKGIVSTYELPSISEILVEGRKNYKREDRERIESQKFKAEKKGKKQNRNDIRLGPE